MGLCVGFFWHLWATCLKFDREQVSDKVSGIQRAKIGELAQHIRNFFCVEDTEGVGKVLQQRHLVEHSSVKKKNINQNIICSR